MGGLASSNGSTCPSLRSGNYGIVFPDAEVATHEFSRVLYALSKATRCSRTEISCVNEILLQNSSVHSAKTARQKRLVFVYFAAFFYGLSEDICIGCVAWGEIKCYRSPYHRISRHNLR